MPASTLAASPPLPAVTIHKIVAMRLRYFVESTLEAGIAGAVAWLDEAGFSVGPEDGTHPRGIVFGPATVPAWPERRRHGDVRYHGLLTWDDDSTVQVLLYPDAPRDAVAAFMQEG